MESSSARSDRDTQTSDHPNKPMAGGDDTATVGATGLTPLPATGALTFRAATPADVEALVGLVESAYRGDSSKQGWTTEADILGGRRTGADDVGACIDRPESVVLIAQRDGELLACAHIAIEDGAGYFGMFSVSPTLQGGGIGKALMAEAERVVRDEWQLPVMRMTVIDIRDELIAFYERRGYVRTGIKKPFPYGDARFGEPKRDDLRFEVLEKSL
ncbi:GNAT family N-acetyltransferase [Aerolutibacter ruishenii]|uniref:Ribosomal protein S18 acetylase RimI-like enzyme n=1 Tax=Aerolutibacter ruishenii TaxID=686800 RepID=A0A562LPD4_9GAMM|nr:GNAT family N-acetyltransferase [Lysobacter ruishenii]TWI09499.1 ribosomal protein S18 acetylase RimI-like enzyme [Lysobacter ruishenii]